MSSNKNQNSLDLNIKDNSVKFCDKVKNNFLNSKQASSKENFFSCSFKLNSSCNGSDNKNIIIERSYQDSEGNTDTSYTVFDPYPTDYDFANEDDIIIAFAKSSQENMRNVIKYLMDYMTTDEIAAFLSAEATYSITLKAIKAFDMTESEYDAFCKLYFPKCCFIPLESLFNFTEVCFK